MSGQRKIARLRRPTGTPKAGRAVRKVGAPGTARTKQQRLNTLRKKLDKGVRREAVKSGLRNKAKRKK